MASPPTPPQDAEAKRERIRGWLREGKSYTDIEEIAKAEGWKPSRGWISKLAKEGAGGGAPAQRVQEQIRAAGAAPTGEDDFDLVELLAEQLRAARALVKDPELPARDRAAAVRTVAELARQLREAQREARAEKERPQVVFYFPEITPLKRLEAEEE